MIGVDVSIAGKDAFMFPFPQDRPTECGMHALNDSKKALHTFFGQRSALHGGFPSDTCRVKI